MFAHKHPGNGNECRLSFTKQLNYIYIRIVIECLFDHVEMSVFSGVVANAGDVNPIAIIRTNVVIDLNENFRRKKSFFVASTNQKRFEENGAESTRRVTEKNRISIFEPSFTSSRCRDLWSENSRRSADRGSTSSRCEEFRAYSHRRTGRRFCPLKEKRRFSPGVLFLFVVSLRQASNA